MEYSRLLCAFISGEASPDVLVEGLKPHIVISEGGDGSVCVSYSDEVLLHMAFTKIDLLRQIDNAIRGGMSLEELARWAGLLTLLDVFDLHTANDEDSDKIWNALDRLAHPELSGIDDVWQLRELRTRLATP